MSSRNLNNYHWTEGDITSYTEEYLKQKLTEHDYKILSFECESYVVQRMGDVNLLYFIDFTLEKDQRTISLKDIDQFTDFSELKESDKSVIRKIFDSFRSDAISKYSSIVLSNETDNSNDTKQKLPPTKVYPIKDSSEDRGNINLSFSFNRNKDELIKFLFDRKFIMEWSNGKMERYNKTGFLINNEVAIFNIRILDSTVICDFGIPKNNKFNRTVLEFVDESNYCRMKVNIQSANRELKEMYENLWKGIIINPMCFRFGFILLDEDDD